MAASTHGAEQKIKIHHLQTAGQATPDVFMFYICVKPDGSRAVVQTLDEGPDDSAEIFNIYTDSYLMLQSPIDVMGNYHIATLIDDGRYNLTTNTKPEVVFYETTSRNDVNLYQIRYKSDEKFPFEITQVTIGAELAWDYQKKSMNTQHIYPLCGVHSVNISALKAGEWCEWDQHLPPKPSAAAKSSAAKK